MPPPRARKAHLHLEQTLQELKRVDLSTRPMTPMPNQWLQRVLNLFSKEESAKQNVFPDMTPRTPDSAVSWINFPKRRLMSSTRSKCTWVPRS